MHWADRHEIRLASKRNIAVDAHRRPHQHRRRQLRTHRHHRHAPHRQMHARSATGQRYIQSIAHEHRDPNRCDQRPTSFHERPRIRMFQSQEHHRCATTLRRTHTVHQAQHTIAQVVRHHAQAKARIIMFDHHRDTHE